MLRALEMGNLSDEIRRSTMIGQVAFLAACQDRKIATGLINRLIAKSLSVPWLIFCQAGIGSLTTAFWQIILTRLILCGDCLAWPKRLNRSNAVDRRATALSAAPRTIESNFLVRIEYFFVRLALLPTQCFHSAYHLPCRFVWHAA